MALRLVRFPLAAALLALAVPSFAQGWAPRGAYPSDIRHETRVERADAKDAASPARARTQRVVLEVEDGQIRLNGRSLDPLQRPAALGTAWPNALGQRFVFSGPDASTVEINGVRYRVGRHGLTIDTDLSHVPDAVVSFLDDRGQTTLPFGSRSLILVNETAPYAAEQEYGLEVTTFSLATQIRATPPGPERDALQQQLQAQLRELFEFKQAQRARELDALERELDTLRQQHAARSRNREAIVRQRMQDLLAQ